MEGLKGRSFSCAVAAFYFPNAERTSVRERSQATVDSHRKANKWFIIIRNVTSSLSMRILAIFACALFLASSLFAQNWKQVHRSDEAKWAKTTGLDPTVIHKLWRDASQTPNQKDDDSRIANIDLDGLAERHDVLLVTYAGEKNCLTLTVFREYSEVKFSKVWSVDQSPDKTGFCDTPFGSAAAEALNGAVTVRVPKSTTDGAINYTVYVYEWNGITYRSAGQKEIQVR